jgi:hypothetical protein
VLDGPVQLALIPDSLCDDSLHRSSVLMVPSGVTTMRRRVRTRQPDHNVKVRHHNTEWTMTRLAAMCSDRCRCRNSEALEMADDELTWQWE